MNKNKNISKIGIHFAVSAGLIVASLMFLGGSSIAQAAILNRQLQVGMSGSDVSAVQSFLAQDVELYPQGLVTGYFGFLTKSAVSNFQSRNGIDPVGRIGPVTLPVLNAQMANGIGGGMNSGASPSINGAVVSASKHTATVNWSTDQSAKGIVYYSTSPLSTYENFNSVNVSGGIATTDTSFHTSQSVLIQNLQANTTYYYLVYTTNQSGNVSVTWPSTFQTTN
jgi:peptidoglycan hydrolase-like protein with peptidoglycan-binding domain